MGDEVADIDLSDPELEKAATKIQATFKGFKARREMDPSIGSTATGKTDPPPEEEVDIDLTDPEVAKAATKIQASFKGYKARKEGRTEDP